MVLIITHFFKHFFNPFCMWERNGHIPSWSLTDCAGVRRLPAVPPGDWDRRQLQEEERHRAPPGPCCAPVCPPVHCEYTTYLQSSANDLHPQDCVQVASCELARASEFPTLGAIVRPLVSHQLYERWGVRSLSLVRGQVTLLSEGSGHSP